MRTTEDLISELRSEAVDADFVLLAVGFEAETKMIASNLSDAQALEELNVLVDQGGCPLGFIRMTSQGNNRIVEKRSLAEYGGDLVPDRVLGQICDHMADGLEVQYGIYAQRIQTPKSNDHQ